MGGGDGRDKTQDGYTMRAGGETVDHDVQMIYQSFPMVTYEGRRYTNNRNGKIPFPSQNDLDHQFPVRYSYTLVDFV